jgi:uncharacterized protein YuzE
MTRPRVVGCASVLSPDCLSRWPRSRTVAFCVDRDTAARDTGDVHVEYDTKGDQAYIYLRPIGPGEAVTQIPVEDIDGTIELVLDLDREGRLIGIEITGGAAKALAA